MIPNRLWKEAITACSFDGLVPKVTVRYADGPYNRPFIVITRETTDTDTNTLGEVSVVYDLATVNVGFRPAPPFVLARIIFDFVCGNLTHDVGEFFRFHGKAIFDPHVNNR